MLLAYRENPSFCAVSQRLGVHHQTVQRCVERALADGALAAYDDRQRPGKQPTITSEAKAWLVSLACDKAKDNGCRPELWTTLCSREVCKILGQEIKPHKVSCYLENRDAEFAQKIAEALCVYREVQVLEKASAKGSFCHAGHVRLITAMSELRQLAASVPEHLLAMCSFSRQTSRAWDPAMALQLLSETTTVEALASGLIVKSSLD
ncbi:hypothetical protein [Bradyrhizobium sp. USDA 4354]